MGLFGKLFGAQPTALEVFAPVAGTIVPLSQVKDPVFSEEILGKGCALEPSGCEIAAPFDGTVENITETKHALGVLGQNGVEVLIHVGMDTVELKGRGFQVCVEDGQAVRKGDLLLKFDRAVIEEAGFPLTTPVIVTNTDEYAAVELAVSAGTVVAAGDAILKITQK